MAVRVLFVDGTDTVYYGAYSASRQGQHVVVTKNRDNGPPALVAALKAERVAVPHKDNALRIAVEAGTEVDLVDLAGRGVLAAVADR